MASRFALWILLVVFPEWRPCATGNPVAEGKSLHGGESEFCAQCSSYAAACPMAMHCAMLRTDACASCVAEKHRPQPEAPRSSVELAFDKEY